MVNTLCHPVDEDRWGTLSPPASFERNQLFLDETAHFLAMLRGEEVSRCNLDDGIKALALTETVHQSSLTGQEYYF